MTYCECLNKANVYPMQKLRQLAQQAISEKDELPFSVYSSVKEQRLLNVPIIKPLLIIVLGGVKKLGKENKVDCPEGTFVFLSNSPDIDMRNIPNDDVYMALLIEFEYEDFREINQGDSSSSKFVNGPMEPVLNLALEQFVQWAAQAPSELWATRRRELVQLFYQMGYKEVAGLAEAPSVSHKVHDLIRRNMEEDLGNEVLANELAMSESTLRRRLQAEGTSIQEIKDRTKLGYGLHLIQTTMDPIGRVAEQCGYGSQSRFTDRFKSLFGLTPSELRKTRLHD